MRCPKCGCQDDKVIDSRASREGATIRRRRECAACNHRFTTYEEVEHEGLMVLKRDGRHEEFSREKLLSGIRKACQKRPVTTQQIEAAVAAIEKQIQSYGLKEIPAKSIGEMVMITLAKLDKVAYVRFASVYREFRDVEEFVADLSQYAQTPSGGAGASFEGDRENLTFSFLSPPKEQTQ